MNSQSKVGFAVLLGLLFALAACAAPNDRESEAATVEPTAVGDDDSSVLTIYNWDTYIDPQILTDFEELYGITIDYRTFEDNESMLETVQATPGVYDIVVPTDYMVAIMRQEGLLEPLRKEFMPNMGNLDPAFLNLSYDPANRYCFPYQWGTMGIGYNIEATGRELDSWADLFDPEFNGRSALIDDSRGMLGIALLSLGYSPNTTRESEIQEARDWILQDLDNIAAIAPDTGQDMLAAGEVDVVVEWSGDIFQVMEENPDLRYVVPKEGSILWTDNICILKDAPNRDLAEQFINYLLDADVGAALSNYVKYGSPNEAAYPLINEEDRNNPALYPPDEVFRRLFGISELGSSMNAYYETVWEEILEAYTP